MHSPSDMTEHVSLNFAGFFFALPCIGSSTIAATVIKIWVLIYCKNTGCPEVSVPTLIEDCAYLLQLMTKSFEPPMEEVMGIFFA